MERAIRIFRRDCVSPPDPITIGDIGVCTPNLDRCAQAPIRKPSGKELLSDALTLLARHRW
jgi:hypothetical protein